MTTQEIINYYANLLILQYLGKPRAYATIQALVTPVIMDQLPLQVQNAYEINSAVGVQLDVLGKYAGVTRSGNTPTGPITLTDDEFRILIQLAIITNSAGSSLATIQNLLFTYFPNEIAVFDYQNMQMSYYVSSSVGSQDLVKLFISEGLLPAPMGVQIASVIYVPDFTIFFGFRTYSLPGFHVTPFNTYSSYSTSRPWLTYADAI